MRWPSSSRSSVRSTQDADGLGVGVALEDGDALDDAGAGDDEGAGDDVTAVLDGAAVGLPSEQPAATVTRTPATATATRGRGVGLAKGTPRRYARTL